MISGRHPACPARRWGTGVGLAGGAVAAAAMITAGSAPVARADTVDAVATPAASDPIDALVLIPAENAEYADAANALYLAPNGFDGTATVFFTPDVGNEVAKVAPGVQALVQAIEADYTAGDLSAADPLYVFGYSAGAVEEGLAEQQLAADGIPSADLNFVMVGDSASAEGGFLNSFVDSFPASEQTSITELLAQLGVTSPVLGATTPDDLYPTEVYSLSADGWANFDDGANVLGMFTDHLAYLGLTPADIASATETTQGMTDYYTINSSDVDLSSALYNTLLLALDIAPGNVTTDAADAGATPAAASTDAPGEVLGQADQELTKATSVLDSAPTASLDSSAASVLAEEEPFAPILESDLTNIQSIQDGLPAGDQTLLADVDQGFVTAYQGLVSADQAFVAADQAGELSSQASGLTELEGLSTELGLAHANFAVDPAAIDLGFVDVFAQLAADIGLSF
jgi:PE-PPE domain